MVSEMIYLNLFSNPRYKSKKTANKNKCRKAILPFIIILGIFLSSCTSSSNEELKIHFLDVGQADCILIQGPTGKTMLIDAGNNGDSDRVVSYIHQLGITKIDVLIGTHPHEDHIGGLDAVIENFSIGTIYMPKVVHTTKTYEDVLTAIKSRGYKISSPTAGLVFNLGAADCTILAPVKPVDEDSVTFNNMSIVVKMVFGETSFLFQGDAEEIVESQILESNRNIKANLIKLGHHGSNTSSSYEYLKSVNPEIAIISVGEDNSYGHPHNDTLATLEKLNIDLHRTDESGTIIATSDGNNIILDKNKSTIQINAPPTLDNTQSIETLVYVTDTGSKYHVEGCSYLNENNRTIHLTDAKNLYEPCKVCNPPY